MDEAFIYVTVISSLFGILGLLILDRNWFRRERFKFEMDTQKKEMSLRFKKMARDLGLDTKTPAFRGPASSPLDTAGGLLQIAKNLGPDQLGALAGILGGKQEEVEEEEEGLPMGLDSLVDFATKNPDLVKGFLDGMKNKLPGGGGGGSDL
jgi:hypothetical protein